MSEPIAPPGRLLIEYEDSGGTVTQREISELTYRDFFSLDAFCHLRGERRTFAFLRIKRAIKLETGEVIPDLRPFVGLNPLPPPPPRSPAFLPPEKRSRLAATTAEAQALRGKQKRELAKRYGIEPVYEHFRAKLVASFGKGCFRCGAAEPLVLDHFVPLILGGQLVPGNIMVLCRRCNEAKGDLPPELYFSSQELARLVPLLEAQVDLMRFEWRWTRWNGDRAAQKVYLLEIGLDPCRVEAIFENPEHPWYIAPPDERFIVRIGIDGLPDGSDDAVLEVVPRSQKLPPVPDVSNLPGADIRRVCIYHLSDRIHTCVVRLPAVLMKEPERAYFRGYCDTCGDFESFQYHRIVAVKDARTGADVPSLHELLQGIHASGPAATFRAFVDQQRTILEFAAFIGKAGRANRAKLKAVLHAFIRGHFADARVPDEAIAKELPALGGHAFRIFECDARELATRPQADVDAALTLVARVKALTEKTSPKVEKIVQWLRDPKQGSALACERSASDRRSRR